MKYTIDKQPLSNRVTIMCLFDYSPSQMYHAFSALDDVGLRDFPVRTGEKAEPLITYIEIAQDDEQRIREVFSKLPYIEEYIEECADGVVNYGEKTLKLALHDPLVRAAVENHASYDDLVYGLCQALTQCREEVLRLSAIAPQKFRVDDDVVIRRCPSDAIPDPV